MHRQPGVHDPVGERVDGIRVGQVHAPDFDSPTNFRDGASRPLNRAGWNDDPGARFRQRPCRLESETGIAPRNDCKTSGQILAPNDIQCRAYAPYSRYPRAFVPVPLLIRAFGTRFISISSGFIGNEPGHANRSAGETRNRQLRGVNRDRRSCHCVISRNVADRPHIAWTSRLHGVAHAPIDRRCMSRNSRLDELICTISSRRTRSIGHSLFPDGVGRSVAWAPWCFSLRNQRIRVRSPQGASARAVAFRATTYPPELKPGIRTDGS